MERGQGWSFSDFKHEGFESRVRSVVLPVSLKTKQNRDKHRGAHRPSLLHPVVKTPPFLQEVQPGPEELGSHTCHAVWRKKPKQNFLQMIVRQKNLLVVTVVKSGEGWWRWIAGPCEHLVSVAGGFS